MGFKKLSEKAISHLEEYGYMYSETPEEFTELVIESVPFHEAVLILSKFSNETLNTHINYGAYQKFHIAIKEDELYLGTDQIEQLLYDLDMAEGIWTTEEVA